MDKNKILTKEIAEKFLKDNSSVNLENFTSIEDDAAAVLNKHKGWLDLKGLTSLSDAAAKALGKHKGHLCLDRLTGLSEAAAQSLAKHEGNLYLWGLKSLSDATAKSLAKHQGELFLGGLMSLSDKAAAMLAKHCGRLDLRGLASLSDAPGHVALAKKLAKHKGQIHLRGLTSLDDKAAAMLAKHKDKCGFLGLEGLTTLSDEAAEALAQHEGTIYLSGVESLSDKAALALAKHNGSLNLHGLTSLGDSPGHLALAARFGQCRGHLDLSCLKRLGDAAAQSLSKHEGDLYLTGLESLSDEVAAALVRHKGKVEFGSKVSRTFKAYKSKPKSKKKTARPQIAWNADFLKTVKNRWKKELLLKENFDSAEDFLAGLVSRGMSQKDIISWLESMDICMGGDAACQKAVEFGWLVGAWDVSYNTLLEAQESQNPDQLVAEGAEIAAEALKG